MVAIWSEAGGQDDLIWSTLKKDTSGKYQYICNVADHKTAGKYQAHVYLRHKSGVMQLLGQGTFEVSGSKSKAVTIEKVDAQKGTCQIKIEGVTSPSGIQNVVVPVWSKKDQSDIVWYAAEKISAGTYRVNMDIGKHKYNVGKYQVHVYVTNGNQIFEKMYETSVEFNSEQANVTAEKKGEGYLLKVAGVKVPGGFEGLTFAVWSEENGQDDLKWNQAKIGEKDSGQCTIALKDYKSFGKYQVHAYAQGPKGRMIFLGGTTFAVNKPSVSDVEITPDNNAGKFRIVVKGAKSATGIQKVVVPVWSAPNQNDLVWYEAEKKADGSYEVNSNISKHKYNIGAYHAHVYVYEKNGLSANVYMKDFQFAYTAGKIEQKVERAETKYYVSIQNIKIPA